jgi:hypothetical protein
MSYSQHIPDKQHRIQLSATLMGLTNLSQGQIVALCENNDYLFLRNMDNVASCEIIDLITIDKKNRIIIPKLIRQNYNSFKVYVTDGEMRIKGML